MIYNTKLNKIKNIGDLYTLLRKDGVYSFYIRLSHSYGNRSIDTNEYTSDNHCFCVEKHRINGRISHNYIGGQIDSIGDNFFNSTFTCICKQNNELNYYDLISCLTKIVKYTTEEYGKSVIVISEKEFLKDDYEENRNYIINLLTKLTENKNIDIILLEDNITLPVYEEREKESKKYHTIDWGERLGIHHQPFPAGFGQAIIDGQVINLGGAVPVNMGAEPVIDRNMGEEGNEQNGEDGWIEEEHEVDF